MVDEDLEGIDLPEDTRSMVKSTAEEIERLDKMLRSYMEFAGRWKGNKKERIALDKLISDIILFLREEFSRKGIALILKKDDEEEYYFEADPQLIRQVIINILINSRDLMEDGAIYIELKKSGRRIVIVIEDEGPGIDDGIKDKIFEPFFSTKEGGFGLGLATVKKIIEGMDGIIRVENGKRGARFRIEL
jgi:signal transduction histidine kinase